MKVNEARRWILLRGLSRGRGHWADFSIEFSKQFPNDEIEFLDLPGNGERNKERSPRNIPAYVESLRSQSRLLSKGSVHILALSLGGMIATEWARLYPSEVEQGYLVCTSSAEHSSVFDRFKVGNYPSFLPLILNQDQKKYEEILLSRITNNEDRRRYVFDELVKYSEQYPARVTNFLNQIFAASLYKFPSNPPANLHLIGSYGDRLVAPQCTLSIAKLWNLKPAMHPWAGHDIPIDDPQWLLQRIKESLPSNSPGNS